MILSFSCFEDKDKNKNQREKTKYMITCMEARKTKTSYHSSMSAANSLINQIRTGGAEWAWANNQENCGKIQVLVQEVSNSVDEVGKDFLVREPTQMKPAYGEEKMIVELQKFIDNSTPKVHELQAACMQILARQNVRKKGK